MPDNSNQPAGNPRRRIVIPLGSEKRQSRHSTPSKTFSQQSTTAASARPRRSLLFRVLLVLSVSLVVVVLLAAGGIFFWWQHYKTTPAYTLAVLVDAAQRNDVATLQSVIDSDQLTKNFAEEVTDKAASRYGVALGGNAREQIRALTPALMPRMKDNLNETLATRIKEFSERAEHKPFILVALGLPYAVDIAVSEDNSSATVQMPNQKVKLEMLRTANGWKVVAFRDEAMVQRAIDQVVKDLPAIGVNGDQKETDARKRVRILPPLRIQ